MKIALQALACGAALALAIFPARAQVSTNSTQPAAATFFQDVGSFFSSLNPSNSCCWTNSRLAVWTGAVTIQGGAVPMANEVGGNLGLYQSLALDAVVRQAGVAGTLLSGQAGLGLNFNLVDVRITPYADGGYNVYQASGTKGFPWFGEVGARVSKALGAHTFTWVSLGVDAPQKSQVFGAGVGFTW